MLNLKIKKLKQKQVCLGSSASQAAHWVAGLATPRLIFFYFYRWVAGSPAPRLNKKNFSPYEYSILINNFECVVF